MWRGDTVVANLVATVRLHVEMEPTTCGIRRCADWYIYLPIILRILQLQYPFRTVRPFVCSSERTLEKFLLRAARLLWGRDLNRGLLEYSCKFLFININQLDALNFIISLFQASTCFEHMCLSSGGQNCIVQSLVSFISIQP